MNASVSTASSTDRADPASDAAPKAGLQIRPQGLAKRTLDVILCLIGIAVSSPLWFLIAVAIKAEDRGPVFYRQARHGRGGKAFRLLKFRTMRVAPLDEAVHQALVNDRRVTRVGSVLRATGLDELPQLVSIIAGHMSLVGPRALALGEAMRRSDGSIVEFEEIPGFEQRLAVMPGLTSPATIYLPKDADPLEKLEYDLAYIRDHSFWLDLRLILLSLWISIRGKWETRDRKL